MNTTTLSGGRGWLEVNAAASIARIDAELGRQLQISDAGRTRAEQQHYNDLWNSPNRPPWLFKPAPAGESPHESGVSVDTDEWRTLEALLNRHGWYRSLPATDPVHFNYDPARDTHRGDTKPTIPTKSHLFQEEEMTVSYINVPGRPGVRRGGCYAVMRSNAGVLFARFVSGKPHPSAPTIDDNERALREWDATFGSSPGLK